MSTVLTAESARDVRLAWFHYKNVTHRAALRRDATRRDASRRAAPLHVPRSRAVVVNLSTMRSFVSLSLSFSLSLSLSLSLTHSLTLCLSFSSPISHSLAVVIAELST